MMACKYPKKLLNILKVNWNGWAAIGNFNRKSME
jgi:hypothetical protein